MFDARRFTCAPLARLETPAGGACRLYVAESFGARMLGLAGLPRPPAGRGLLLARCRSVHTLGMRFPIDVVFLSWPPALRGRARVLELREALSPGRVASLRHAGMQGRRRAVAAVELAAGRARALGLREGMEVQLRSTITRAAAAPLARRPA